MDGKVWFLSLSLDKLKLTADGSKPSASVIL